VSSFQ